MLYQDVVLVFFPQILFNCDNSSLMLSSSSLFALPWSTLNIHVITMPRPSGGETEVDWGLYRENTP